MIIIYCTHFNAFAKQRCATYGAHVKLCQGIPEPRGMLKPKAFGLIGPLGGYFLCVALFFCVVTVAVSCGLFHITVSDTDQAVVCGMFVLMAQPNAEGCRCCGQAPRIQDAVESQTASLCDRQWRLPMSMHM